MLRFANSYATGPEARANTANSQKNTLSTRSKWITSLPRNTAVRRSNRTWLGAAFTATRTEAPTSQAESQKRMK